MNGDVYSKETNDALSRWWWPGQWLRIVYGVWVDQVWYWENIRPLLSDRKQRLNICIQSLLGTALVVAVCSAALGGILAMARIPVNWNGLIKSVSVSIGVAFGAALFLAMGSVTAMASYSIVWGVVVSMVAGSVIPMIVLGVTKYKAPGVSSRVFMGLVSGIVVGISAGVFVGVARGVRLGMAIITVSAVSMVVVFSITGMIVEGISGGLTFGLGVHLGGRWATRQIPDAEIRKHLANPDI